MDALWLVRHAETEWSRDRRHTGHTDIPLTDDGRAAAAALKPRLAEHEFARVLVSPLARARETAELAGLGDRAEARDDLMEWDYGDYEGLTSVQIREQRPGWYLWHDGCPGGEDADAVGARADRIIAEALDVPSGDVVCVAHGHLLRVLAARWLQQPAAFGGRLVLETGAICRLGFEHERRALRSWNG